MCGMSLLLIGKVLQAGLFIHGVSTLQKYPQKKPMYRDADKSLARPGRKQATATEDFDVHISYL